MSYITPQDRTELVELKLKIRPEVVALLDEYAAWLKSEKGYVVQEVLRKSIAGDKEFQRARKAKVAYDSDELHMEKYAKDLANRKPRVA